MPCSSTSQLNNASTPVLPLTQPTTPAQWNYFVARLQDIINSIRDASNRQPVNVVPADYAVYNGSALPALSIIGATSALDTTKHQFGSASLKLTATAATVTVEFSANPILLQPNARWIESVYIQSSRSSIVGTLAIDTPTGSYPVDISGKLLSGTWGRLYGDCDLTADFSTTATLALTLTGCTVGDTFNLEGWQIESGTGSLPSPFVNTTVPQDYVDTADNAAEALANANAAQSSATAANAQLADIASDNILSPAEKPTVIRDYAVITAEQAGIDGQAVAYGITTQKAAYDAAIAALTAYLATLTTATAWNDKSGNTTIVGTTFRANFNTVYTTRQTLLNAIYAAAQGLANAAQGTANTANTTANTGLTNANTALSQIGNLANSQYLQNPFFSTGDLTGWTSDHGTVYYETGGNGPSSASTSYAVFPHGTAAEALRNIGRLPVYPGAVVKAQCAVRGVSSPNGTCGVRISWRDATDAEISNTPTPNPSTGNATNGTYVTATAPAGAMFAHVECATAGRTDTTGYYTVDNFAAWALSDTLDQVPDSTTYGKVKTTNLTSGNVDLSASGVQGKNLDNITDSATYLRTIQQSHAVGALTIDNATFQLGTATGWTGVNASVFNQTSSPAPAIGSQYIVVNSTIANGSLRSNRKYSCNPGDKLSIGGLAYAANPNAQIQATFWTAAGAFVSIIGAATASANWTVLSASGVVPSTAAYFTIDLVETTASGFALFNYVWCSINDVRVAGSGTTIGDQRNLQPITWASQRSVLSNSPISFSISGTTVTFSVAAVTLQGGGISLNYGASSGSVTQAAGTTSTWFLYYRDAPQAGGSLPLAITTNPGGAASFADSVFLGTAQVTVAAGGGGSSGTGGGGGGYCVADDMFIGDGRRAGDAEIGDPFDCIDLPTAAGKHVRTLQGVTRGTEECVRMITSDGCALVCSASTPFDLPDGRNTTAPRMLGEQVITDLGTAIVTSLALVGPRPVTRAHLGGVSYAAGADAARRIYSHNAGTEKP